MTDYIAAHIKEGTSAVSGIEEYAQFRAYVLGHEVLMNQEHVGEYVAEIEIILDIFSSAARQWKRGVRTPGK